MTIYFQLVQIHTTYDMINTEVQEKKLDGETSQNGIDTLLDTGRVNILKPQHVKSVLSIDNSNTTPYSADIIVNGSNKFSSEIVGTSYPVHLSTTEQSDNGDTSTFPTNYENVLDPTDSQTCRICGANATKHIHYGARSCQGCRAFFRRTVNKNIR